MSATTIAVARPHGNVILEWWRQRKIRSLQLRIEWVRAQPCRSDGDKEYWIAKVRELEQKLHALR